MASGKVFIRRTTAFLLLLCVLLSVAFVVVLSLLLKSSCQDVLVSDSQNQTTKAPPSTTPAPKEPWEINYRIPEYTVPLAYDLYLFPNLKTGRFSGKVNILIDLKQPTDYFVAHIKYLDIIEEKSKLWEGKVSLGAEGKALDIAQQTEYEPNEFWVVRLNKEVSPKLYTLHLEFEGSLTDGIVGFYRSVYKTKSGEERYIATSKFQPTYARRAFPCFDEPSFKSNFTVTLVKPSDEVYIALSNMNKKEEILNQPENGFTEVKFHESVPMVTYLACFIVCDFRFVEKTTNSGKPFRVYAQADQLNSAQYALDIGTNILNYFETYFGLEYPLPKLDMIAIPDFVSGAMEHWGLITYRETNLLYDEKESSSKNKQRVATVVSHELAHMWFGNLMTLKWWDDLWLNEGFASYIEYKGVNEFEKDWDLMSQFLSLDLHRVMKLDDLLSSHPIVQTVNHPDEITEIFDTISYSKGASVLRMLESFLGEEVFRKGIHNFLDEYKFKNAETKDLWAHLEAVSPLEVGYIMDTWTRQMGYPVVNLKIVDEKTYELTQDRFIRDPEAEYNKSVSLYKYRWEIQVSYITPDTADKPKTLWMHTDDKAVTLNFTSPPQWIKLNLEQVGYYRVNYPENIWKVLTNLLKSGSRVLNSADRSSLLSDAFSLAEAGHIDYAIPLELTLSLEDDDSLVVWKSGRNLVILESLLYTTEVFPYIKKYLNKVTEKLFTKLGWEDTGSHTEKLLRVQIVDYSCRSGNEACLDGAKQKFIEWISNENYYISPNLRSKVYKYGIRATTNTTHWDIMWQRYLNEQNAQEKSKLLYGLAMTDEPWRLHRFLELAQNESYIRRQDYFFALQYVAANTFGTSIAWDYLRANWENLVARFTLNSRFLGRTVLNIAAKFTTQFKLDEVNHFFSMYPDAGAGRRGREQAIEYIETSIKWIKNYKTPILKWFQKQNV